MALAYRAQEVGCSQQRPVDQAPADGHPLCRAYEILQQLHDLGERGAREEYTGEFHQLPSQTGAKESRGMNVS